MVGGGSERGEATGAGLQEVAPSACAMAWAIA